MLRMMKVQVALVVLVLGGCATVQQRETAAPPPSQGTKLAQIQGSSFEPGKTRLNDEGRAQVDQAVRVLQQHPDVRVLVEGHTDSTGSERYNQSLSELRAKAVANEVVAHGIPANRLSVKGFGEMRPVADNASLTGRNKNRRVEIVVQ